MPHERECPAGLHLIKHAAHRTLERGGQFVLLGSAPDPKIQVCMLYGILCTTVRLYFSPSESSECTLVLGQPFLVAYRSSKHELISIPNVSECAQAHFNALAASLGGENAHFAFFYDESLSHLIYAGCDLIAVPSMFEPCGLTQVWIKPYPGRL